MTAIRDHISLTWERGDGLPLSEEHDINENILVLKNVQKHDQGVYNCVGYRNGHVIFTRPITLKVVGKCLYFKNDFILSMISIQTYIIIIRIYTLSEKNELCVSEGNENIKMIFIFILS